MALKRDSRKHKNRYVNTTTKIIFNTTTKTTKTTEGQ